MKDDIYDLTSELKFIYDIYNIPSTDKRSSAKEA